ncbi:hypothetical protein QOT17_25576 [Balamuthia mandrillaris]
MKRAQPTLPHPVTQQPQQHRHQRPVYRARRNRQVARARLALHGRCCQRRKQSCWRNGNVYVARSIAVRWERGQIDYDKGVREDIAQQVEHLVEPLQNGPLPSSLSVFFAPLSVSVAGRRMKGRHEVSGLMKDGAEFGPGEDGPLGGALLAPVDA